MNEIAARENKRKDAELNQNEILNIINQLPFNSNVTFTGGEIFLKKGIEEIIRKTAEKQNVTLATNGLLLSKYAELVIETGVKAIGVSLDGPPNLHNRIRNTRNAFDQLENSLHTILEYKRKYKSADPRITVNSVILKDNYDRLSDVVKIVKNIGLSSCSFQILDLSLYRSGVAPNGNLDLAKNPIKQIEKIDPIKLKASLVKIIKEGQKYNVEINFAPQLTIDEIVAYYQGDFNLSNWRCNLPWNTMRISPYGDVYPCLNLFIGNAKKNKLKELWNHPNYLQFRQNLEKITLSPACVGCCKKLRKKPN
jgi:MoaA/NifB/PqqE/SkfB family radical SAM enzyme